MLGITFGLGVVMVVALVISLLRLTATTNPAGCIMVLGILVLLIFGLGVGIPWLILAG